MGNQHGSMDLHKIADEVNYRFKWIDLAGQQQEFPELKFVDMGEYGSPKYLEHFRQWADNVIDWQKRQKLTRKVKTDGSLL